MVPRFFLQEIFHLIPVCFCNLVFNQTDGADIERFFKQESVISKTGKFCTSATHIDIQIRIFTMSGFRQYDFHK